ncbi:MAG: molybdopterin-dependent oxidoreductase [Thermomicrobiales bacterium]|nr:molybdopterin-dependent oxidoreductase [Thermomicrobiales bacterium]
MTTTSQPDIQFIRGACPHDCPDTCSVITGVQNGRAISFEGNPEHPITRGWLCAKVRPYLDRVYHEERLLYPLRRTGPKGSGMWERISWDDALAEIKANWERIIAEDGAQAILPYSYSGTLGAVQGSAASSRFWLRLGATGLERSICDAAASVGIKATYGGGFAPDLRDVVDCKFLLIWGTNPASTSPHSMPFIREAQKNGCHVVVIDPRRSLTARSADEYIPIKPATDAALALGMINLLFEEGLADKAWLEANTIGWRDLRDRAAEYPLDKAAEITGIPAEKIADLTRRFAAANPAQLKTNDGIQRHGNSGQTFRAVIALPAVAGKIGVKAGGLTYSASGFSAWDSDAITHMSDAPTPPRFVNMNRLGAVLNGEVAGPPIRSLFVFSANPATSTPNTALILKGLLRDDLFTVVHEQFMTDTALYADIVLPATTQLEQEDIHKASGHRFIHYNNQALDPPGETVSNWDLMRKLSALMGFDEPWLHLDARQAAEEILTRSQQSNPNLRGICFDELRATGVAEMKITPGMDIPFADGIFPTPSGKLELRADSLIAEGLDPLPHYAPPKEFEDRPANDDRLILISAASHHFVSSSMANQPKLEAKEGLPPRLDIHPADAATRGISDDCDVMIANQRGWAVLKARLSEETQPGVVVAPKGRWGQRSPGGHGLNWTTSDDLGDTGRHATFHSNLVTVTPVER